MFIETLFPYKMKLIEVDPRIITEQHNVNIDLLKSLKSCIDRNEFPDGSEDVERYEYRGEEGDTAPSEEEWLEQTAQPGQDTL